MVIANLHDGEGFHGNPDQPETSGPSMLKIAQYTFSIRREQAQITSRSLKSS
jgi:hypothetical protein